MNQLKINEIFASIQGEGYNFGHPFIFVRLSICNLSCPFCDTKHEEVNYEMTPQELLTFIRQEYPQNTAILWTGGEPMLQLNERIVDLFSFYGYRQAIETNGTFIVPFREKVYLTISPKKQGMYRMNRNFQDIIVDEIRLPIQEGDNIPENLPVATRRYLSPVFDSAGKIIPKNLNWCLILISKNPNWLLSVQVHKLLEIR